AIHEDQRLGVLHVRPPSHTVRRDGGGGAHQSMRRMPRRQRREDRYDLDSVLSAASRQAWLLEETEHGGDEQVEGNEHVEGDGNDGVERSSRTSLLANERDSKCRHPLSEVSKRQPH